MSFLRKSLILSFSIALILLTGCEKEQEQPVENKYFVEVTYEKTFSASDGLKERMDNYGISPEEFPEYQSILSFISSITAKFHATVINYNTKDPNGNDVIASGVIYYPEGKDVKGVIEITPITRGKKQCPSKDISNIESSPFITGYAILIPDLIGAGATENMTTAVLIQNNNALVSADLRKAAEEYFRTVVKKQLPSSSILFGFSLGASTSLALAQFYQEHTEYNVSVSKLYIGSGVYDLNIAMNNFAKSGISQVCVIPELVTAMDYYYNLDLDYSQIFTGELLKNREEYCSGDYSPDDLLKILGTDIHSYMNPDYFTEEKNAEINRLSKTLEKQNLIGAWMPNIPVTMYHGTQDQAVPVACSDALYTAISSSGKVTYNREDTDHNSIGVEMFKMIVLSLLF